MTYRPSAENLAAFPLLRSLSETGKEIPSNFRPGRKPDALRLLPGGQLYFDSRLELDTDGWPGGNGKGDKHFQRHTSYHLADGSSVDANTIPYFVLPKPVEWPKQFNIWLGDVAAIFYKGRLAFGVFADFGGEDSLGEGSLELFRQLGMERLRNGQIRNVGSKAGAITIVFPGSRPALKCTSMQELADQTQKRGREHFDDLFRAGAINLVSEAAPLSLAQKMVAFARSELNQYGGVREEVEPLNSRIAEYWRALGLNFNGTDHQEYWSAAFVSFVVAEAGGADCFECNKRHSAYVHRAIRDKDRGLRNRFWGHRPHEIAIAPGDILAMNQSGSRTISFEEARNNDRYSSHSDIVVECGSDAFKTIGGNVGNDTVGEKIFVWRGPRLVRSDNKEQQVFAVLRPPVN